MKNKLGSAAYLCIVAAILAVIACFLYRTVMNQYQPVYYMLIGTAAAAVVGILLVKALPGIANYIPIVMSFLIFSALVWATNVMTNELGYVVAGLYSVNTIISYFVFIGFTLAAGLFAVVASFLTMAKEA